MSESDSFLTPGSRISTTSTSSSGTSEYFDGLLGAVQQIQFETMSEMVNQDKVTELGMQGCLAEFGDHDETSFVKKFREHYFSYVKRNSLTGTGGIKRMSLRPSSSADSNGVSQFLNSGNLHSNSSQ